MRSHLVKLLLCLAFISPIKTADAAEPFAVVELFGSEGCSSCPPADDLLRELTQLSRSKGYRVFTLSFHVDYWNNLGWVDPYSQAQFTKRQYEYAAVFNSPSVYTPQMVINGTTAFVGSEGQRAKQEIQHALQTPSLNDVSLKIKKSDAGVTEVVYNCQQLTEQAVLNLAFVERGLEDHIIAGENSGNILKHDNVVRAFKTVPLTLEGMVSFLHPAENDLSRFSIIAYVQDSKTMRIIAANSIDLK